MVSRFLHFAREMRLQVVQCDLADVVDDALSLAGGAVVEKLIKVSTRGPQSLLVSADPLLLGQALLNLILNAVQASKSGGAVVVEFAADAETGKQFRLAVEDSGAGLCIAWSKPTKEVFAQLTAKVVVRDLKFGYEMKSQI
jgi:signal transduction histidine kinase